MAKIRVLIVEDNPHFREALKRVLPFCAKAELVGEADCAQEAMDQIRSTQPDLVLLDLSLPRISGIDIIRQIRLCSPKTRILLLTIFEDDQIIAKGLDEGADGYCNKDRGREEVKRAVEAVMRGEKYVSPKDTAVPGDASKAKEH
jgi:NarL family two-component system response regulator YdfI